MNLKTLTNFYILIIFLLLVSCSGNTTREKPTNIILMIGDGMGTSHIYAGMVANRGPLNLEKCQYVGFQKTYASNNDVTDSGASATSMASGIKTPKKQVGLDPDGNPVITIVDLASENKLSTGLISTTAITHATPASFVAHNDDRYAYEEIAVDISQSGVDLLIGGGRNHFNKRKDGLNLMEDMETQGYFIAERIDDVPAEYEGAIAIFTDPVDMPWIEDGRGDILARSTELAVERLSKNSKGFFLMVEGSFIDKKAHKNNTDGVIAEVLDFDLAVGKALDFAMEDGNTLVIITADHETGGFSVVKGGPHNPKVDGRFTTGDHTGEMVPVFTYGPGSEEFAGIYENTEIFEKMKSLLGL